MNIRHLSNADLRMLVKYSATWCDRARVELDHRQSALSRDAATISAEGQPADQLVGRGLSGSRLVLSAGPPPPFFSHRNR